MCDRESRGERKTERKWGRDNGEREKERESYIWLVERRCHLYSLFETPAFCGGRRGWKRKGDLWFFCADNSIFVHWKEDDSKNIWGTCPSFSLDVTPHLAGGSFLLVPRRLPTHRLLTTHGRRGESSQVENTFLPNKPADRNDLSILHSEGSAGKCRWPST